MISPVQSSPQSYVKPLLISFGSVAIVSAIALATLANLALIPSTVALVFSAGLIVAGSIALLIALEILLHKKNPPHPMEPHQPTPSLQQPSFQVMPRLLESLERFESLFDTQGKTAIQQARARLVTNPNELYQTLITMGEELRCAPLALAPRMMPQAPRTDRLAIRSAPSSLIPQTPQVNSDLSSNSQPITEETSVPIPQTTPANSDLSSNETESEIIERDESGVAGDIDETTSHESGAPGDSELIELYSLSGNVASPPQFTQITPEKKREEEQVDCHQKVLLALQDVQARLDQKPQSASPDQVTLVDQTLWLVDLLLALNQLETANTERLLTRNVDRDVLSSYLHVTEYSKGIRKIVDPSF